MSGRRADVLKKEFVKEYIVLTTFQKHSHQLKKFEKYGFYRYPKHIILHRRSPDGALGTNLPSTGK